MTTSALTPRQPVPALSVPLVNGQTFVLGENPGQRFDLLGAIDFAIAKDYPARGEYTGPL